MMLADAAFTYVPGGADWVRILPELVMLVTALLVLLADLAGSPGRRGWLAVVGLIGVLGAVVATVYLYITGGQGTAFFGMMSADETALFADLIVLFAAGAGLLLSPGYIERQGVRQEGC